MINVSSNLFLFGLTVGLRPESLKGQSGNLNTPTGCPMTIYYSSSYAPIPTALMAGQCCMCITLLSLYLREFD